MADEPDNPADDDEDPTVDAPDDPGDDDPGDTPADDVKPATKPAAKKTTPPKAAVDAAELEAQLKKANGEAAARRSELKKLTAEIERLREANATAEEKALLQAKKDAATEAEAKLRPAVVRAAARAALGSAGCTDPDVQRTLLRLLDTSRVELDDDGEVVDGLDDQLDDLKAQFPEKFETRRQRVPSARDVDAGDRKPPAVKKTTSQLLADRALGRNAGR